MEKRLTKEEAKEVLSRLMEEFPDAKAELNFSNSFELLIATILSAQCTDVQVNKLHQFYSKTENSRGLS